MREAEHLVSLPVVQWSSLTPSSPSNWVMVGGGDGCMSVCGDDGDEGEEVVGF